MQCASRRPTRPRARPGGRSRAGECTAPVFRMHARPSRGPCRLLEAVRAETPGSPQQCDAPHLDVRLAWRERMFAHLDAERIEPAVEFGHRGLAFGSQGSELLAGLLDGVRGLVHVLRLTSEAAGG